MSRKARLAFLMSVASILSILAFTAFLLHFSQMEKRQVEEHQRTEKEQEQLVLSLIWSDILNGARKDKVGTLGERIRRQTKYQERLKAVEKFAILNEEMGAIVAELDFTLHRPDHTERYTELTAWEAEFKRRFKEVESAFLAEMKAQGKEGKGKP